MPVLKLDIGARPMGLGGSYVAVADDIYGLSYNPAGLASIKTMEIGGTFFRGVSDTRLQYYALAFPLPFYGISGTSQPRLAFGLLFSQNGTIGWNQLASDGSILRTGESRNAGGDFVLTASYSEKVYESTLFLSRLSKTTVEHSVGLSAKMISSRLPNTDGTDAKASALSADAGYLANLKDYNTTLGVSVTNASGELTYLEDSATLPLILRGGASYRKVDELDRGVMFTADYLRYYQEEANRLRVGMELLFEKYGALRVGYRFLEDDGSGFTAGAGATMAGASFDFGFALGGDLDTRFQFGLTYKFPPMRIKVRQFTT
ncbi:MAG: PorV/PorQ family protein, partial [Elusimicrobiaceae bacterium]|nr:PorV/PorQ family protein [Elusimicrobiaceae bacterium]